MDTLSSSNRLLQWSTLRPVLPFPTSHVTELRYGRRLQRHLSLGTLFRSQSCVEGYDVDLPSKGANLVLDESRYDVNCHNRRRVVRLHFYKTEGWDWKSYNGWKKSKDVSSHKNKFDNYLNYRSNYRSNYGSFYNDLQRTFFIWT